MNLLSGLFLLLLAAPVLGSPAGTLGRRNGSVIPYAVKEPPLTTPWTYEVGTNPWTEYPRPKLQRPLWQSLNGIWTYEKASNLRAVNRPPFGEQLAAQVMIPSCLESGLSGIMGNDTLYSWFSTHFTVPPIWSLERILLHFGAVDYEATVFVNGHEAGFHRGGYFEFTIDVTPFLIPGSNELYVLTPMLLLRCCLMLTSGIDSFSFMIQQTAVIMSFPPESRHWYRAISFTHPAAEYGKAFGSSQHQPTTSTRLIWTQPHSEKVSAIHCDINSTANQQHIVTAVVKTADEAGTAVVSVLDPVSGAILATQAGPVGHPIVFKVPSPKLWSPDTPVLYPVTVSVGFDLVRSYVGFRTIEKGILDGVARFVLNGEPVFMIGTLDQGFWPDGLYTPPNLDAMVWDLKLLKKLGFNMLRKHVKVETALFYHACDQIGLLVIQDMPALRPLSSKTLSDCSTVDILPNSTQQAEFERQLFVLVDQLKSHPSIVMWVIYNEGWGQITKSYHPEFALTVQVRELDPTRLVNSASGWQDYDGDFMDVLPPAAISSVHDNHHYSSPQCGEFKAFFHVCFLEQLADRLLLNRYSFLLDPIDAVSSKPAAYRFPGRICRVRK